MSGTRRDRAGWPPLRHLIFAAVLAAGLLTAAASYLSPWFAFQAMRSAAAAGDVQGLDAVMDVAAMRDSLTSQVDAYLPQEPPPEPPSATTVEPRPRWLPDFVPWPLVQAPTSGPLERLTRPVTRPARIRRETERLTTPESLARLSAGRAHVRDWGLRRFRIGAVAGERETVFTLSRTGWFDWEVVHMRLPLPVPSSSAGA